MLGFSKATFKAEYTNSQNELQFLKKDANGQSNNYFFGTHQVIPFTRAD
jgi:hypothetical protein